MMRVSAVFRKSASSKYKKQAFKATPMSPAAKVWFAKRFGQAASAGAGVAAAKFSCKAARQTYMA